MITIEQIEGRPHTVVWHGYTPKGGVLGRRFTTLFGGIYAVFMDSDCLDHIATALPPLPRNPKPKDAPRLHLYAAHGIGVYLATEEFGLSDPTIARFIGRFDNWWCVEGGGVTMSFSKCRIRHAIHNRERVEIAIEGK